MEVKINIPDNCELVQEGNTYIVKEKQKTLPKTWEEFCENYPNIANECWVSSISVIEKSPGPESRNRHSECDKNLCSTKEEAEAFLALIQLRRLRNAWVESAKEERPYYSIQYGKDVIIKAFSTTCNALTFPTETMAIEFVKCFKDLILKAKILL